MSDEFDENLEQVPVAPQRAQPPITAPSAANWFDQDDLLRTLWRDNVPPAVIGEKLGRSVAAIMTRAVRLGLPRRAAPGRKTGYKRPEGAPPLVRRPSVRRTAPPRTGFGEPLAAPDPPMPVGRMCLNKFSSEGRHNRICPMCKGSAEYVKGSSLPETGLG